MELLVTLDALRRASARRITAVIPYFGYARQDRKSAVRTPISAKLVANMITAAGADRVLTLDLHAGQIQGFFDIPWTISTPRRCSPHDIQARYHGRDLMIVSPDVGGVVRARARGQAARRRPRHHRQAARAGRRVRGDEHHRRCRGPRCILIDDIVDPAGTLCNAAEALMERGASSVARLCHARRAVGRRGGARRGLADRDAGRPPTSSARPRRCARRSNIRQLTIAPLMAEAILRISEERSVSSLFV